MRKLLKRRSLPFLALLAIVITSLVLPIGAEVNPATAPEYESPVDWSDYPGSNLLPFPYTYLDPSSSLTYSNAGITYTLLDYGIFITSGNLISSFSYMYLARDLVLAPGTYSVSSGVDNVSITVWCKDRDLNTEYSLASPFTIPVNADYELDIYVVVDSNLDVGQMVYPMLNKGSSAAPYQPYLPYWFQQAYDDGYEQGAIAGFTEGSKGANNLFYGCTVKVVFSDEASEFVDYTFTYDQIPFNNGVLRLGDLPGIDNSAWGLGYVSVQFIWPSGGEWYYPSGFVKTNCYPGQRAIATVLNPPSGNRGDVVDFDVYFPSGDVGEYGTVEFDYNYYYVKSLYFQYSTSDPLPSYRDICFVSNSYQYNSGYNKGYADGINVQSDKYIQQGYDKGVSDGYKNGFADGKQVGLDAYENGGFADLMYSVVDAPVRALTGLLDFELLGTNMLSFLGSILSLCLLIIFIKKVVT